MKYLIEWWPKEPVEANMKKVLEIETERNKKKVAITESVFPIHYSLSDPHAVWIVEDDIKMSKISKWVNDYYKVATIKITPLVSRAEMEKL